MKHSNIIVFFAMVLLMASCSATSGGMKDTKPKIVYTDLVDLLRTKPGLDITGTGAGAAFKIRGVGTMTGDTRPMFYLNGSPAGRDFAGIYGIVNVQEVESVQIIPRSRAARFGDNGDNGVIMITTKG